MRGSVAGSDPSSADPFFFLRVARQIPGGRSPGGGASSRRGRGVGERWPQSLSGTWSSSSIAVGKVRNDDPVLKQCLAEQSAIAEEDKSNDPSPQAAPPWLGE
jgi:hypothetical protein